jgi:hypothetical protein
MSSSGLTLSTRPVGGWIWPYAGAIFGEILEPKNLNNEKD